VNGTERVIAGKSRFLRAVLAGGSLEDLIAVGEQVLGNPIMLGTPNHFIWYVSADMPPNHAVPHRKGPVGEGEHMEAYFHFSKALREQSYCIWPGRPAIGFCALRYRGRLRGYSALVGRREIQEGDFELHQAFCAILVQELEKRGSMEKVLQLSREEALLFHLLEEPGYHFDAQRLEGALPLDRGYMELVAVRYRAKPDSDIPSLTMMEQLRQVLGCRLCFGYENMAVALTQRDTARENRQALVSLLERHDLLAGVSYPFSKVQRLRQCYDQASAAIVYGMRTGKGRVSLFSECAFYHVARDRLVQERAADLCRSDIRRLARYDEKYRADLLLTLRTYLECGCNIRKTAASLGIHRNSALARLERIREIAPGDGVFSYDGYFSLVILEADEDQP
jgi:hypothetical protein